jgi:hypothetical protein
MDFETFESKLFLNSIQNLNHEDFRNKAFRASFQISASNEFRSKLNFNENERFLYA